MYLTQTSSTIRVSCPFRYVQIESLVFASIKFKLSHIMKFFVAFVIVYLAAPALAENQETSLLLGKEHLFESFCVSTAKQVKEELSLLAREKYAVLFTQFFGEVADIGDEVLRVQNDAVQRLSSQLSQPSMPVNDDPMNEDEINRMIEKTRLEIQQKAGARGLAPAIQGAGLAILSTLNSALFLRLAKARGVFNGLTLQRGILDNCDIAHSLAQRLNVQLQDAKQVLLDTHNDPETQKFISKVTLPTLHCFTTRNVVRLSAFCKIFRDASGSFMKMLGIPQDD